MLFYFHYFYFILWLSFYFYFYLHLLFPEFYFSFSILMFIFYFNFYNFGKIRCALRAEGILRRAPCAEENAALVHAEITTAPKSTIYGIFAAMAGGAPPPMQHFMPYVGRLQPPR